MLNQLGLKRHDLIQSFIENGNCIFMKWDRLTGSLEYK